jgi:hypothetical protein
MDVWSNNILEYLEEQKEYEGFSDKMLEIQDFYSNCQDDLGGLCPYQRQGKVRQPSTVPHLFMEQISGCSGGQASNQQIMQRRLLVTFT